MVIRPATPDEAASISALAMRPKAAWGYSPAFMDACCAELTWSAQDLETLFVEPARIGTGVGRALIEHVKSEALARGAQVLLIQGDPHAAQFYRGAGAEHVGARPSESVPGRSLPLFAIELSEATS